MADEPDIPAWVAAMTQAEQVDTAVATQLLRGERVLVEEVRPDGWARVVALDQPADRLDPRGYPGWLRFAHLSAARPSGADILAEARRHLGTVYVWGGLSPYGLDCSGLVHLVWRHFGIAVPRDASEQALVSAPVAEEDAGDLYFFANPGRPIHHVGIVVEPGRMVHASSVAHQVVEEPLSDDRQATLVGAYRIAKFAARACRAAEACDRRRPSKTSDGDGGRSARRR